MSRFELSRSLVQPPESRICGQVCVAIIANRPLENVIEVVGHRGLTTTAMLCKALKHFGYSCHGTRLRPNRLAPLLLDDDRPLYPETCLLKRVGAGNSPRCWHWVCRVDGRYYDPAVGLVTHQPALQRLRRECTSYLGVGEALLRE